MGRARKPLNRQAGHLLQFTQVTRQMEEAAAKGDGKFPAMPIWIKTDKEAANEWRRVARDLRKTGLIGTLDRDNLAGYCKALANYIRVTDQLKDEDYLVPKPTQLGDVMVPNPLVAMQHKYADEMRRFGRLCGLTLDSRLKAAAIQTAAKEDSIEKQFGAI